MDQTTSPYQAILWSQRRCGAVTNLVAMCVYHLILMVKKRLDRGVHALQNITKGGIELVPPIGVSGLYPQITVRNATQRNEGLECKNRHFAEYGFIIRLQFEWISLAQVAQSRYPHYYKYYVQQYSSKSRFSRSLPWILHFLIPPTALAGKNDPCGMIQNWSFA